MRAEAEAQAAGFPGLLAEASQLAATVSLGAHGRRRAGPGDEFWQYRPAVAGDAQRQIDWRRSARADGHFVRQMEWQNLQAVHFWIDQSASMAYRSTDKLPAKGERARVLGLAIAILLTRAGESFGLMQDPQPPRSGRGQVTKMAMRLGAAGEADDYGVPPGKDMTTGNRAVFVSDFLGDWDALLTALGRSAEQRVQGCLIQVLDPVEEAFPFDGRTIFESMSGAVNFETRRAKALRDGYLERLAARKDALAGLARETGWTYLCHHTDKPARPALMWAYNALSEAGL
ncbi:MAG: DUF58 domain-containing protein [Pseudomonadota bacterium]